MNNLLPEDMTKALDEFMTPKFMITQDSNGEPNTALVMTWTTYDNDKLVYGDFMTFKSRQNLLEGNSKMALLVLTMDLYSWLIKADFESFHQNDEVYEFMAMKPLFRYNQYTNARGAGLAIPKWTSQGYGISKLNVLSNYIKARMAKGKVPFVETKEGNMSPPILRRFAEMAAVKVIAFIDEDGYPAAFPAFGMVPSHPNRLVVKRGEERRRGYKLRDGQRVAVSLVTLEPAAFQVKGTFREISDSTGVIELDRVFVCSLPRPGLRVDLPLIEMPQEP
ncbi:MAG: hypothetical protein P1Q69_08870 [Candidatus Thorarchaeota archaeon]|nr:hypothetical protein [Candidatus Thorarchaeota archaeon]